MSYLLLFTITPVQDFISQSRKLKDLFGSSKILSDVSEIGIKICKRDGAKIIFPFYEENKKNDSYPNRFLVEFQDKNIDEVKKIAKEIKKNLENYLLSLSDKESDIIKEHIKHYFTFYWAISEIKNGNYKKAFDEVEKQLAGAKNTRFFNQLGDGKGEVGRKCSICGERNAVVYNEKLPMSKEQYDKAQKSNIVQSGEGLCGVCYIKRKNSDKDFNSTAEVALMHIFEKLKKNDYPNLKEDAQLFFEENLSESYFEKNKLKQNLEQCKKDFKKFKNDLKENNLKQTPYYATIMFDGDSMGEWLKGEDIEEDKLKNFHTSLSQKLVKFAKEAKGVLEEPKGLTVYAGGEDFLGFINLNYLFEILKELREKWNKIVNEPIKKEFYLDKDFTFSAGIVIAHYKTPLQAVLQKTREAERKAKEYEKHKKDKICLVAMKRSGEVVESIAKYSYVNELKNIYKNFQYFSDKFIRVLDEEFLYLCDDEGVLNLSRRKSIIETELERLLYRAKKVENLDSKVIEDMKNSIQTLIDKNFKNFINCLYIISFLKRETDVNKN